MILEIFFIIVLFIYLVGLWKVSQYGTRHENSIDGRRQSVIHDSDSKPISQRVTCESIEQKELSENPNRVEVASSNQNDCQTEVLKSDAVNHVQPDHIISDITNIENSNERPQISSTDPFIVKSSQNIDRDCTAKLLSNLTDTGSHNYVKEKDVVPNILQSMHGQPEMLQSQAAQSTHVDSETVKFIETTHAEITDSKDTQSMSRENESRQLDVSPIKTAQTEKFQRNNEEEQVTISDQLEKLDDLSVLKMKTLETFLPSHMASDSRASESETTKCNESGDGSKSRSNLFYEDQSYNYEAHDEPLILDADPIEMEKIHDEGHIPKSLASTEESEWEDDEGMDHIPHNTHDREKAEELKQKGNAAVKKREYKEALEFYHDAISYSNDKIDGQFCAILHANCSACHYGMGDYAEAIATANRAIKLDPTYVKGYIRLFRANSQAEKYNQAVEAIQEAFKLSPALEEEYALDYQRISDLSKAQMDKDTKEMVNKLKEMGNWLLDKVGLSLDNFKVEQNEGGSYNVSFQQKT